MSMHIHTVLEAREAQPRIFFAVCTAICETWRQSLKIEEHRSLLACIGSSTHRSSSLVLLTAHGFLHEHIMLLCVVVGVSKLGTALLLGSNQAVPTGNVCNIKGCKKRVQQFPVHRYIDRYSFIYLLTLHRWVALLALLRVRLIY